MQNTSPLLLLPQAENRALRLREPGNGYGEITAALLVDPQVSSQMQQLSSTSPQNFIPSDSINVRLASLKSSHHKSNRNLNNFNTNNEVALSSSSSGGGGGGGSRSTSGGVSWDYFDERGYISGGGLKTGEDPYIRNRFNQQASDSLPSNRDIPDTRTPT